MMTRYLEGWCDVISNSKTKNYVAYHVHSDYSLLDSVTNFKDYVDMAKELGQKAIAISEHGKPMDWVKKKIYCDENNIKYLHAVECYLTETLVPKVRDNYHTILIAKNYSGLLEINRIISKSCDEEHFYYVNRISFDEFFRLSNNVIKISACLASPLNKLPITHDFYEKLVQHYDYLEIQPHNHPDQIAYNIHLATLSEKYHKPLIAGTDAHSLNEYKAECRKILLIRKRKSYGDEDSFDLTYKSYTQLVEAFENQGALPTQLYMSAIENTNVMADSVEDFELDRSLKYPLLYGSREADAKIFHETIERKFKEKVDANIIAPEEVENFKKCLAEECEVFSKIGMEGFMLSMSELISWCRENDIPIGVARGSVGGSRVAYVTDITDLNSEKWKTVFSRFCNESRVEVGDIDVDVIESDRPKIFQHILSRFGCQKTARVASFGTNQAAGAIDDIGGALRTIWNEEHGLKGDDPTKENPYHLKVIDAIKKEFAIEPEQTRSKYPQIFYYLDGLVGIKVSQSVHPAGMVISPITLDDHYGTFEKDGAQCLMLNMDDVHEIGLVKYDFLILNNIKIISDTCKYLGKPYPRAHEIDWNDKNVWDDMLRSPTGIFQMEGEFAFKLLKSFSPQSIFDMSLVTAAIRPSGASYRNDLIARKPYHNPSKIIDDLLKDNNGYLIYQEDTIKFLQEICGMSGSEADNVRRAIGRKQEDRLEAALPAILDGYCAKSNKPRAEAEKEAEAFLTILKDSAAYQFGYNHSIAYCLIGYICAYLRYYHPLEFITAYLNNAANSDDVINGTKLAAAYGIKIISPKYGFSKGDYSFSTDENVISKGLQSIAYLGDKVANELFNIAHTKNPSTFMDLLLCLNQISINSRQLDILIKIDFFDRFGNCRELSRILEVFNLFKKGTAKQISKEKLSDGAEQIVQKYATDTNKKGEHLKSYTITDISGLLTEFENHILGLKLSDVDIRVKIQNSVECLGYVDITTNRAEDRRKLIITSLTPCYTKDGKNIWCYRIGARSIGTGNESRLTVRTGNYNRLPIKNHDIIYADGLVKNNRGYWELTSYHFI